MDLSKRRRRAVTLFSGEVVPSLDAPTNVVLVDNGDGTWTVTWTDAASAPSGYRVYFDDVLQDSVLQGVGTYSGPFSAEEPDPLTAGTATATAGDTQVTLSATQPTGGTGPYTVQWYRSESSGVKGDAIIGADAWDDLDTGLTNGTTYYYTPTATDALGATVDYDQQGATPAAPGTANWAYTDFETSTPGVVDFFLTGVSGPCDLRYPWFGDSRMNVLASDPTASGHGQVLEIDYSFAQGSSGEVNRAISLYEEPLADVGLGEQAWVAFDIYINGDPNDVFWWSVGRKHTYFQRNGGTGVPEMFSILGWDGDSLEIGSGNAGQFESYDFPYHYYVPGRWYRIEHGIQVDSARGSADGQSWVYLNGVLVSHRTALTFTRASGGGWDGITDEQVLFSAFQIGDQINGGGWAADNPSTEKRYLAFVGYGSTRIGTDAAEGYDEIVTDVGCWDQYAQPMHHRTVEITATTAGYMPTVHNGAGNVVGALGSGRTYTLSSSDTAAATVPASTTGTFTITKVAAGETTITVTDDASGLSVAFIITVT